MTNCDLFSNRYFVMEMIGRGGMSNVYKVKDVRLNTVWAMKEINAFDSVFYEAGIKEMNILKELNHPALPRIVDIVQTKDSYCVIMDYIEGINLEEYVQKNGSMTEKDAVKTAFALLDALKYLHSKKRIIYSDLKPSNIMLSEDGEIKLVDFGISANESPGKEKGLFFTKEFAAPEMLAGKGVDERSDIYGLGATLKHIADEEYSFGFDYFLKKCMKNDPDERYQSAAEAWNELSGIRSLNDARYRKIRKAIGQNIFYLIMFILSFTGVCLCEYCKGIEKKNEWEKICEKAVNSSDIGVRMSSLEKMIEYSPEYDLYLRLINEFKDDLIFDEKEESLIEGMLERDKTVLKERDEYALLCKEIGKLYLFYHNDENENSRYQRAVIWFEECMKEGGENVETYVEIGRFFEDLKKIVIEGRTKGEYRHFFDEIYRLVKESGDCDERTKKDIYEMCADSVYVYSGDFYRDGVESEEMRDLLSLIEQKLHKDGKSLDEENKRIMERIKEAKDEIDYIEDIFD
ncbi:MAG: serine/threonine protein kinase [Lachnospiraceae bacterium]|nr:serine/threonine protein kinase [Lachnospiraceae bacterium]